MALAVVKRLDDVPERERFTKQCLGELLVPATDKQVLQDRFVNFRLQKAEEHMNSGPKADPAVYTKQLEFLNNRIKELGLNDHDRLMMPPVVFNDPASASQCSYYAGSAGYTMINVNQINEEDSHLHEMVHAASVYKFSIKVVDGVTNILNVKAGACLTRDYTRPIFSIFNEYAAISMERDYRIHTGAVTFKTQISDYSFLTKEQKDELLPLSRLVDADGRKGLIGKFVGWLRRKVKKAQDYSFDFEASVRDGSWPSSDYLSVYTDVNHMLLEVGAKKLGLKHKYKFSKEQEHSILSSYKDEIQIAAFTGSIKKVAMDFKDTYGKRGLHFLSDVVINGNSDRSHLHLIKLFARAGHISNPKRRNMVREKIMDFYYESKKRTNQ